MKLSKYYIVPCALVILTLIANVLATNLKIVYATIYSGVFWYLIVFTMLIRAFHVAPKKSSRIGVAVPVLGGVFFVIVAICTIEGGPYGWGGKGDGPPVWVAPGIPLAEAISDAADRRAAERRAAETPDARTADTAAILGSRWLVVKVWDFAVQQDGRFLLLLDIQGRETGAYRLVRLGPDGTPDPTFRFSDPLVKYDELVLAPDDRFLIASHTLESPGPLRLYSRDGDLLQEIPLATPLGERSNFHFGPGGRVYTTQIPRSEDSSVPDLPARIEITAFDLVSGAAAKVVRDLTWLLRAHPELRSIEDVLVAEDGKTYVTASFHTPGDDKYDTEYFLIIVPPGAKRDEVIPLHGVYYSAPIRGFLRSGALLIGKNATALLYQDGAVQELRAPMTTTRVRGEQTFFSEGPVLHPAGGFALLATNSHGFLDYMEWSHPIEIKVISADGTQASSIAIPAPEPP